VKFLFPSSLSFVVTQLNHPIGNMIKVIKLIGSEHYRVASFSDFTTCLFFVGPTYCSGAVSSSTVGELGVGGPCFNDVRVEHISVLRVGFFVG